MSDIKLFNIDNGKAFELSSSATDLEKDLQKLIEGNLDSLLGMRFLASEYSTGKTHAGRIDTLALDENSCPVILEYKRHSSENVINQGLFYLDWLFDHQAEFELLVLHQLGKSVSGSIDWSAPRLVCVAIDFSKYDAHAVQQINRNIELIRYRKFGSELLLFELVNAVSASTTISNGTKSSKSTDKPVAQCLAEMKPPINEIFDELESYLMTLGDDVQRKDLKLYVVYKKIRNFVCVVVQKEKLLLHVALNPDNVDLIEGFTRDMKNIGHWGTGDLEITLKTIDDLEKTKTLLKRSYDGE